MQSIRSEATQAISESKTLMEKIKTEYFQPFIESMKKSGLDEFEIIQNTLHYLQLSNVRKHFRYFHEDAEHKRAVGIEDVCMMPDIFSFKQELNIHPDLKENFIRLGEFFLDLNNQKEHMLPEIQTRIKELFHDYLNPLPEMNRKNWKTISIESRNQINNNGDLFNIPVEIQQNIYSYLNHESVFSFKKVCKSSYFLHKSDQDTPANIFYLVAGMVPIAQPRGFFESELDIIFRNQVEEKEIIDSLCNNPDKKNVRIFLSLYQAIEYSHYLSCNKNSEPYRYMPSLWVVSYIGNPVHLKFIQAKIKLNGKGSSVYYQNNRDALISYADVPKHSIQPLLGSVVFSESGFAKYTVFNMVDFMKYKSEIENSSRDKCLIM